MLKPLCEHFRENKNTASKLLTKDYSIIMLEENENFYMEKKLVGKL